MLNKFKSFIGYNNENDKKEEVVENKKEPSIDTVKDIEKRTCDCCNEEEVIIETSEKFVVDENGNKTPLFSHARVTVSNGGVFDDVAICNNCFESCETDAQKQYVWIFGKMNSIHKEVLAKQEKISENNQRIEEIRLQAEEEMKKIMDSSNGLAAEINTLQNTIELYAKEQQQLESEL